MKITAAASRFCKILAIFVKVSLRETGARKRLEKTAEIRAERQKRPLHFGNTSTNCRLKCRRRRVMLVM